MARRSKGESMTQTSCRICGEEVWTLFPKNPLCHEHKAAAMDVAIEAARGGATLEEALRQGFYGK